MAKRPPAGRSCTKASFTDGEIFFPFFQNSKTRKEQREHNEIEEMEFFIFFFGPITGIMRGNLPDVQGLPDFLIPAAAGGGGQSEFVLLNFVFTSLELLPHYSSSGGAARGTEKCACLFVQLPSKLKTKQDVSL